MEQERREKEEKERIENEKYLQIVEAFNIEHEGYDEEVTDENKSNLLQDFLAYIEVS